MSFQDAFLCRQRRFRLFRLFRRIIRLYQSWQGFFDLPRQRVSDHLVEAFTVLRARARDTFIRVCFLSGTFGRTRIEHHA